MDTTNGITESLAPAAAIPHRAPPATPQAIPVSRQVVRASVAGALARYRRIAVCLALTDALCILAALLASYVMRFGWGDILAGYVYVLVVAPFGWVGIFHAFHLYSPQRLSAVDEVRRIVGATAFGVMALVMASYWTKASFSREWMGIAWMLVLVLEMLARRAWRRRVGTLRARGDLALRTLIVGTNPEADRLAASLVTDPSLGFAPIGYLASVPGESANHLPVLGSVQRASEAVAAHRAECLFVASSAIAPEDMVWVSLAARQAGVEVKVSANMPQILTSRLTVQPVGKAMALSLRPTRLTGAQAALKRSFDLAAAAIGLILAAPLMAAIALAIRATSNGPALFRQARVTKGGRRFNCLKFRTMVADGDRVLRENGIDPSAPFFKLDDDPRITWIGSFLRKTSLDELPQLINVLKGEMSLVGPRPLPADQVEANPEMLGPRLEVPAGVTGWWQINGRSEVAPEEAVEMDAFYIENWSLTFDLFILAKTAGTLLKRRGAR